MCIRDSCLTLYCNNQENKYVQDTNESTEKGLGEDALHAGRTAKQADSRKAVSYTHLDVYKRQ